MEFGHLTDPEIAEMSLEIVEFVYKNEIPKTTTFISKIQDFNLFDPSKWNQSGYKNASDYSNSLISNKYVEWAEQNKDVNLTSLALKEPVTIRYGYLIDDIHELPFYVAWKKGIYRDAGINITIAEGAPFDSAYLRCKKVLKPEM